MAVYPRHILDTISSGRNVGRIDDAPARGRSASFLCGSYVELSLALGDDTIELVKFQSNGCGYMIAASDALCDWLRGKSLPDLHGLNEHELISVAGATDFPEGRGQCARIVFDALRRAMAEYRERRIEEFQGEKALICTCFGVAEETIVNAIEQQSLTDVEEVAGVCRAGTGCGSCRMLIQELIDMTNEEG